MPTSQSVEATLNDRGKTHGSFADNAFYAQELRTLFRQGHVGLTNVQREALDMIAGKISRILSGNPNEPDHWLDIEGYARLARNDLESTR